MASAFKFKQWLNRKLKNNFYKLPPGERIYAVGDIHGRLDLFQRLIQNIEDDDFARTKANTTIILLGDLIDRGPQSSGVINAAIKLGKTRNVRTLCGNHEEMLLKALDDVKYMKAYLQFGGREAVLSYIDNTEDYNNLSFESVRCRLIDCIPDEHILFLRNLEDKIIVGDYLFVHAGVRPGLKIEEQALADLRWIREPFLSFDEPSRYCVIHGHTICDAPEVKAGRIGIDTGAYQSGKLTALGLEGADRWFLSALC